MPARLRQIRSALERLGGSVEEPASGSHFKCRLGSGMYPLSCHNGERTEVTDLYIRSLCRALGIDVAKFRSML